MQSTVTELLPLVSVIIPCYNNEAYIRQAVDSALNQSYTNLEVIVIDDGSSDASYSILLAYGSKIRLLHHQGHINKGVSYTRKAGVSESKGEWIAFLDADDIWEKDKIQYQIDNLLLNPEAVMCHTRASVIYEDGLNSLDYSYDFSIRKEKFLYKLYEQEFFLSYNNICNSSVLVKRSALRNITFESPQLFQYEDWLMWLLLAQNGPFLFLPEATTLYRFHSLSSTSKTLSNELKLLYSHLEMLLSYISRVGLQDDKIYLVSDKIKEYCIRIIKTYNPSVSDAEAREVLKILRGNNIGEAAYLNNKLEQLLIRLEKSESELRLIKSSSLFQLLQKLKVLRSKLNLKKHFAF